MSVNKNALIRYQTLDRCFRNNGRMYFIEDLLDECNKALYESDFNNEGIQKRQLFNDINFMQSEHGWSIPLEKKRFGKKTFYRYKDTSFSINNQPLNNSEAEQIKSALQIISRFFGTPQFEWVSEMIPMLETKFGLIKREDKIISFESNNKLSGLHHLTPLFNAIINRRALLIEYKDFKSKLSYKIIFHPYHLKQYNNRWFAFGLNEEIQIPNWNLALDRVINIRETNIVYQDSTIDWEMYFYDLIGVTRPAEVEIQTVILQFNSEAAPYVKTKPLHPSQKDCDIESGIEVSINVILNIELEKLILSFGEQVKVISPLTLKERIDTRSKLMRDLYK